MCLSACIQYIGTPKYNGRWGLGSRSQNSNFPQNQQTKEGRRATLCQKNHRFKLVQCAKKVFLVLFIFETFLNHWIHHYSCLFQNITEMKWFCSIHMNYWQQPIYWTLDSVCGPICRSHEFDLICKYTISLLKLLHFWFPKLWPSTWIFDNIFEVKWSSKGTENTRKQSLRILVCVFSSNRKFNHVLCSTFTVGLLASFYMFTPIFMWAKF